MSSLGSQSVQLLTRSSIIPTASIWGVLQIAPTARSCVISEIRRSFFSSIFRIYGFPDFVGSIFSSQASQRYLNRGRLGLHEQLVFVIHAPATIKELTHLNAGPGIASTTWARRDVEDGSCEPYRVIIADSGLI